QANYKRGKAPEISAVDRLIVPGTTGPVIIHQANAYHNSLAARIVTSGHDSSRQTEGEVGIYGVILHVDTDGREAVLRVSIAIGTVICQCQGHLNEAPFQRMPYGTPSDAH